MQGQSSANIKRRCSSLSAWTIVSHNIWSSSSISFVLPKREHGGWCFAVYSCHSNAVFVLHSGVAVAASLVVDRSPPAVELNHIDYNVYSFSRRGVNICVCKYTRNRYHITIKHVWVSLYYGADCVSVCGYCAQSFWQRRRLDACIATATHTYLFTAHVSLKLHINAVAVADTVTANVVVVVPSCSPISRRNFLFYILLLLLCIFFGHSNVESIVRGSPTVCAYRAVSSNIHGHKRQPMNETNKRKVEKHNTKYATEGLHDA